MKTRTILLGAILLVGVLIARNLLGVQADSEFTTRPQVSTDLASLPEARCDSVGIITADSSSVCELTVYAPYPIWVLRVDDESVPERYGAWDNREVLSPREPLE